MFKINNDDLSISLTRGDTIVFNVQAKQGDNLYKFEEGDKVTFRVSEAKDVESVVLESSTTVTSETNDRDYVQIRVTSEEAKQSFEQSNKPIDYWYEISLDTAIGVQTIIGYDDDGAKILRVFPEIKEQPKAE